VVADPKQFARFLRQLHRHDWVLYAKPAMGGPLQVLRYLGRYTHRVAISNHRLVSFDGERVTFRWKDYAHGSKQKKMTLTATEVLRRFFLHVLPKGFVRIRYFGFLANRWRTQMLALARQLLGAEPMAAAAVERVPQPSALWRCPNCGATMVILRRFTPEELRRWFFDSS
jgi:Putative transposase